MLLKRYGCVAALILLQSFLFGAKSQDLPVKRCATMELLKSSLANDKALKERFEQDMIRIDQLAAQRAGNPRAREMAAPVYIPVVFHIVLPDPTEVTDKMVEDQLKVLNTDFAGLNGDSVNIPAAFKPLFGHSKIQFVLAKRTPSNLPTTGIDRVVTTVPAFTPNNNVKHASTGGANT
jgi:hypothetical protein